MISHLKSTLLLLAFCLPQTVYPLPPLDEETEQLFVESVEAAAELDLYNTRCRRDDSGRRTDALNKELASRFRTTVLEVQDDLFPDGSYRATRKRIQESFLQRLKEAGGCREAKAKGMYDTLRARYGEALERLEALP